MKTQPWTVDVVARRLSLSATLFVTALALVVVVRAPGLPGPGAGPLAAAAWVGALSMIMWPAVAAWAVWREEPVALIVCVAAFFLVAFALRGYVGTLPAALGAPLLLLAAFLAIGGETEAPDRLGSELL